MARKPSDFTGDELVSLFGWGNKEGLKRAMWKANLWPSDYVDGEPVFSREAVTQLLRDHGAEESTSIPENWRANLSAAYEEHVAQANAYYDDEGSESYSDAEPTEYENW